MDDDDDMLLVAVADMVEEDEWDQRLVEAADALERGEGGREGDAEVGGADLASSSPLSLSPSPPSQMPAWPDDVPRVLETGLSGVGPDPDLVNRWCDASTKRLNWFRRHHPRTPPLPRQAASASVVGGSSSTTGEGRRSTERGSISRNDDRGTTSHLDHPRSDDEVRAAVRRRGDSSGAPSLEDPWRHFVDLVGPLVHWPFFIRDAFWSGVIFGDHQRMTVVHFSVLNGVQWDTLEDCLAYTLGAQYYVRGRRAQCLARYRYFFCGSAEVQRERRSGAWSYNVTTRQLCTLNDEPCDRRGNVLPSATGSNSNRLPGDL